MCVYLLFSWEKWSYIDRAARVNIFDKERGLCFSCVMHELFLLRPASARGRNVFWETILHLWWSSQPLECGICKCCGCTFVWCDPPQGNTRHVAVTKATSRVFDRLCLSPEWKGSSSFRQCQTSLWHSRQSPKVVLFHHISWNLSKAIWDCFVSKYQSCCISKSRMKHSAEAIWLNVEWGGHSNLPHWD